MDIREELSDRDPDKRLVALSLLVVLIVVGAGVGTIAFTDDPDSPPPNESTPMPPVVEETPVSPTPTEPRGGTATRRTPTDEEPVSPTAMDTNVPTDEDDSDDSDDPRPRRSDESGSDDSDGVDLRTDGNSVFLQLQDAKPGDSGNGSVVLENAGSDPGRLLLANASVSDDENGLTKPEVAIGDDAADGELSDALDVRLYATHENGSRAYFYGSSSNYVTLANVSADDAKPGHALDGGERATVTLEWRLPMSVGNEIQSDVTEFDFSFYLRST